MKNLLIIARAAAYLFAEMFLGSDQTSRTE